MFSDLLTKTYYGNTVESWLIALLIIAGALVVSKVAYWIFSRVVRRITAKTTTRLDDIIVDMVEEPVVFAIAAAGIWYGLSTLTLPQLMQTWIGHVFEVLIVLSFGWLVARLLDSLYEEYLVPLTEKTETDLDDQLLPILRKATKIVVWGLTVVIALNNAGYDVGALLAGLGIGGLALAMAAKDTVANVFGGFTIFADQPFRLNDRIKVSGFDGVVKEIGVRSTRLQTLEGRIVTIPNSKFSDTPVENVSREPSRKVVVNLGLTYDTDAAGMDKAMQILKEVVTDDPELEENTLVGFTEFGESALNLLFIYYIKRGGDILGAQTRVNMKILKEFGAAGLGFAFPTRTVYTAAA